MEGSDSCRPFSNIRGRRYGLEDGAIAATFAEVGVVMEVYVWIQNVTRHEVKSLGDVNGTSCRSKENTSVLKGNTPYTNQDRHQPLFIALVEGVAHIYGPVQMIR